MHSSIIQKVVVSVISLAFATSFVLAEDHKNIPIIPGAVGFGIETPAGSGRNLTPARTNIVRVTNLDDSGPGSLRHAIENQPGPKVIIFEVSGNVELENAIVFGGKNREDMGSYITVAGQTAPSPGITLKNYGLEVRSGCSDIFIQHIRVRPGDVSVGGYLRDGWTPVGEEGVFSHPLVRKPNVGWGNGIGVMWNGQPLKESRGLEPNTWHWERGALFVNVGKDPAEGELLWLPSKTGISDPLSIDPRTQNIVIDHCSFSWGGDMNVKTNANNMSFTNNISSEALHHPWHPKGRHSKGFLLEGNHGPEFGHNIFFARNLMANNIDRNPRQANGQMVIVNNLIYDVRQGPQVHDGNHKSGPTTTSIVGNHIIETRTTAGYSMGIFVGAKPESRIYIGPDNFYGGKVQTDPWNSQETTSFIQQKLFGAQNADIPAPLENRADAPPVWVDGYDVLTAEATREHVLANAGARPGDRCPVDSRIIEQVRNNLSRDGGIIESQKDVGGWPELEENNRELALAEDPFVVNEDGYTNLEKWLHEFAREVERVEE